MQLHQLRPSHKKKKGKRIGRGGKKGTYCGRGVKGQKSRGGRKLKPIVREILKKYPKLRGYRFSAKKDWRVVNLLTIEKKFKEGEIISPELLVERKIIRRIGGKIPKVKILGKGDLTKKLTFKNVEFSKKAKQKVLTSGSEII